jgi:hypothetical protein
MQERITSELWHRFRRLELAGLRLPKPLIAPNHPVLVEHLPPVTGYDIFPIVNGVGVAASVRIIAGASITIGGYRLRWHENPELSLSGTMKPLKWCPQCSSDVRRCYCFDLPSGHHTIQLPNLEKEKVWAGGTLKRDLWVRGCFSAWMEGRPRFSSNVVAASLHIFDLMGNVYPYPLCLGVHPELLIAAATTGLDQSPGHLLA